jgi:hypothetical protein
MGYVLVENDTAVPYSLQQLRDAHPNTSFPKHPSADSLAEFNVFPLNYDPQPDFDIIEPGLIEQRIGGEGVDEEGNPVPGFYGWWQAWTGQNKTSEEKRSGVVVTMRQARLALNQQGLLSSVEDALAALPDGEREAALIEWEYSSTVERLSPLVASLTLAIGLTDESMDDLFALAMTL